MNNLLSYPASLGSIQESSNIQQPTHKIKFQMQLSREKLSSAMERVTVIQQSIGWDAMDQRIAKKRLENPKCPKVLITKNKQLIAYTTLVPNEDSAWYISQIAVETAHQKKGLGREMMLKIFEEAKNYGIDSIYLDVENDAKLTKFYESFKNDVTDMQNECIGRTRFGEFKFRYVYKL